MKDKSSILYGPGRPFVAELHDLVHQHEASKTMALSSLMNDGRGLPVGFLHSTTRMALGRCSHIRSKTGGSMTICHTC